MSGSFKVEVDKGATHVWVGAGTSTKNNTVVLGIARIVADSRPVMFVRIVAVVGAGKDALVSETQGLMLATVVSPSPNPDDPSEQLDRQSREEDVAGKPSYIWEIRYGYAGFQIDQTNGLVLTLSGIVSESAAGKAKLAVTIGFGSDTGPVESYEVDVEKQQDEVFEIVYFSATPRWLPSGGGAVSFSWRVNKASKVRLMRGGEEITDANENNASRDAFKDRPPWTGDTTYQLLAESHGAESVTKEIVIQCESPGWHALDYSGSYGEPATLFGGMTFPTDVEQSLAAVFIKDGKAILYRSKDGTNVWHVESDSVPAGMETSPGVVFDGKLWLVGGSAVSPDQPSNRIWCYTRAGGWTEWGAAANGNPDKVRFSARMGHACVVFNDKLWVLGGFDDCGSVRNDVWKLARGDDKAWEGPTVPATMWSPRCMFGAAAGDVPTDARGSVERRLVVFGGLKVPLGPGFKDLWSLKEGDIWELADLQPSAERGYALASAVSQLGNRFVVAANYFTEHSEEYLIKTWNMSRGFTAFPLGSFETFSLAPYSLTATEFKGRLFLRALADLSQEVRKLHVYVPSKE